MFNYNLIYFKNKNKNNLYQIKKFILFNFGFFINFF